MTFLNRTLWLSLLTVFLAGYVQADSKPPYTLQDLQALAQRQTWDELVVHLLDVPPAQRQNDWNRLVEQACVRDEVDDYLAQECLPYLKSVLLAEPKNEAFAWKAGNWARAHLKNWAAIPFYAQAIQKPGDARCKDQNVQNAIVSGLGLPPSSVADKEIVDKSHRLAFQTCWPGDKDLLIKGFKEEGSYFKDNTCAELKKKGALSKLQAATCKK